MPCIVRKCQSAVNADGARLQLCNQSVGQLSFSFGVMAGFNHGRRIMSLGIWFRELGNDLADIGGAFKDVCIDIAAAARKIAGHPFK
jgi:hypothetical protein